MGMLSSVAPRSRYPSKRGILYDMGISRNILLKKFNNGIPKVNEVNHGKEERAGYQKSSIISLNVFQWYFLIVIEPC